MKKKKKQLGLELTLVNDFTCESLFPCGNGENRSMSQGHVRREQRLTHHCSTFMVHGETTTNEAQRTQQVARGCTRAYLGSAGGPEWLDEPVHPL